MPFPVYRNQKHYILRLPKCNHFRKLTLIWINDVNGYVFCRLKTLNIKFYTNGPYAPQKDVCQELHPQRRQPITTLQNRRHGGQPMATKVFISVLPSAVEFRFYEIRYPFKSALSYIRCVLSLVTKEKVFCPCSWKSGYCRCDHFYRYCGSMCY